MWSPCLDPVVTTKWESLQDNEGNVDSGPTFGETKNSVVFCGGDSVVYIFKP